MSKYDARIKCIILHDPWVVDRNRQPSTPQYREDHLDIPTHILFSHRFAAENLNIDLGSLRPYEKSALNTHECMVISKTDTHHLSDASNLMFLENELSTTRVYKETVCCALPVPKRTHLSQYCLSHALRFLNR